MGSTTGLRNTTIVEAQLAGDELDVRLNDRRIHHSLGAVVVARGLDDSITDFIEAKLVGLDVEMSSFHIKGGALFQKPHDRALWVNAIEKRPITVSGGPLKNLLRTCREPDDVAQLAKDFAIPLGTNDPTSGRDNIPSFFGKLFKNLGFHFPKSFFAFISKNARDRVPRLFHDRLIRIDKRVAEHLRQLTPDGGLPSPHKTNQDDISLHVSMIADWRKETNLKSGRSARLLLRKKRLGEGGLEFVDVREVIDRVRVLLPEDAILNKEKDDLSNVLTLSEAPILQ